MARTKYMMSTGLAFSEKNDMEKLRKNALKGWNLKRFRFVGYELEKGEGEDVIFSIDYRTLKPDEEDEYFNMFSYAGWTHVCSSYDMHIFKAEKGTKPIYSDAESARDKIEQIAKPVRMAVVFLAALTGILWVIMTLTSGSLQNISKWAFLLSFVLTLPAVMTIMAIYYHKWTKRSKASL